MAVLLAMGYIFKRVGFFSDPFIAAGKKFCFYVLLSCSLFKNLYDSSLGDLPFKLIIHVTVCILIEFVIAFFLSGRLTKQQNQIGVMIQGMVRSNFAYIGIPLATMMFTDEATIALTSRTISFLSIFVIPIYNILSVAALTYFGEQKDSRKLLDKTLNNIVKNPCIDSIMAGIAVLLFRLLVPGSAFFIRDQLGFIYKVLAYLAQMSTSFAFLLVGASLHFSHSISNISKLTAVVSMRILIFPVTILFIAYQMMDFTHADFASLVSVFASPTAVASAIMAAEMGGDSELADEIVVYTTVFSILSLLFIIDSLKPVGCF